MTRRLLAASVLAAALLVSGCAGQQGTARPEQTGATVEHPPPGPAHVGVTVTRSGGIAGVRDTVTITPDGTWTTTDKSGRTRTGQLDADRRTALWLFARDVRGAGESGAPVAGRSSCSDAFTYTVTIETTSVGYVDCPADGAPPPATAAIVDLVRQFIWS